MRWNKIGWIYPREIVISPSIDSMLTPTPLVFPDRIRTYFSSRDPSGHGRIQYIDLSINDPSVVLRKSDFFSLDKGEEGQFDDCGMILGDVFESELGLTMAYVGFSKPAGSKFNAFTGLAVSRDGGETFNRYKSTPLLGRKPNALTINAIHSVEKLGNQKYGIYCAKGSSWEEINGKPFPRYSIFYGVSHGITNLENINWKEIISPISPEYRIGRPRVFLGPKKTLTYTFGTTSGKYESGVAFLDQDGVNWSRRDNELGIEKSVEGEDSKHLAYPALFTALGETYMLYNGNNMGENGFGLARLIDS